MYLNYIKKNHRVYQLDVYYVFVIMWYDQMW